MLTRSLLLCLAAVAVFLPLASSPAQSVDGFTVQERAGIVLVKPQPWSKDSEAVVVEFTAFTDRTAAGSATAGYIEFRTKATDRRQVPTTRIVKMVVYPDPNLVKEVITTKDRDSLASVAADLKATIAKFPATRTYIEPAYRQVAEEVVKYDSGKVKTNGVWMDKGKYVAERARTYAGQIRADIVKAAPASSFDLANDPRYVALQELAGDQPTVKPLVSELTALYDKLVRAEKRQALLTKLSSSALSFAAAEPLVKDLRALSPDEDPKSTLFLKTWDAAVPAAQDIKEKAAALAGTLNTELTAVKDTDPVPTVSPAVESAAKELRQAVANLTASQPPAAILRETRQATAVDVVAEGFTPLRQAFVDRQYLAAKDNLDAMSKQAAQVGPEAVRVVGIYQAQAAQAIGEFTRLREEGKLLADAGKTAEAVAAYDKALLVIPDPGLTEETKSLKETLEKANPKKK